MSSNNIKTILEWLPIEGIPIDDWINDWEIKNCRLMDCVRNQTIPSDDDFLLTDGRKVWRDYFVFESRGYEDDDINTNYWAIARDSEPRLVPTHYMSFPKPPNVIMSEERNFNFTDEQWKQTDEKTVVEFIEWLICKGYTHEYIYTLIDQLFKIRQEE